MRLRNLQRALVTRIIVATGHIDLCLLQETSELPVRVTCASRLKQVRPKRLAMQHLRVMYMNMVIEYSN